VLCEPIRKRLMMFVLRSKVQIIDVSNQWALLGIAGVNAETAIGKRFGTVPAAPMEMANAKDADILKLESLRFQIMVPAASAAALRAALGEQTTPAGHETWDLLDIRAGIPSILPETQEQFVPQMANLDLIGGVSFDKGCYPGQEIVARMHYLGKLKQRMYLAHIETGEAPRPGDKVFSPALGEQAAGTLVNAAPAPEGGYDVLAVLQIESANAGDVRWKSPAGPRLQIRPLPYEVAA